MKKYLLVQLVILSSIVLLPNINVNGQVILLTENFESNAFQNNNLISMDGTGYPVIFYQSNTTIESADNPYCGSIGYLQCLSGCGYCYRNLWSISNGNGAIQGKSMGVCSWEALSPDIDRIISGGEFYPWDMNTDRWVVSNFDFYGWKNISLEFDWKCVGRANIEYGRVELRTYVPEGSGSVWHTFSSSTTGDQNYYGRSSTARDCLKFPASADGNALGISFRYFCSSSYDPNLPFIIDNIELKACPSIPPKTGLNTTFTTFTTSINSGQTATIYRDNIYNNFTNSGLTYQWQKSTDGGNTWENVSGTATTLNTGALTQTTLYRCVIKVNPTTCNSNTVSCCGDCCCEDLDSPVVTVNVISPCPQVVISSNPNPPALTCTTTSISATASGSGTYLWSNGLGTDSTVNINSAGTYYVTGTNTSDGCTTSASINITSNTNPPSASISPSSGTLTCTNSNISVTASGGGTYQWSNGLGSSATAQINSAGTFTVTVTNTTNGCTNSASVTISQSSDFPNASINPSSGTLTCSTTNIQVTASGGGAYLWSNGLGTNATANITSPGIYTVTVTNTSNGCSAIASIEIDRDITLPTISFSTNPNTTEFSCSIQTIEITASGGVSYLWSTGSNYANTSVSTTGTYTVTATGTNGCTNTANITITEGSNNMPVTIEILTPVSCYGTADAILKATVLSASGNINYQWSNNANGEIISGIAAGNYSVTATTDGGCTGTYSIQVPNPPQLNIQPNIFNINCYGETNGRIIADVSGGNPPYQYYWNTGNTANIISNLTQGSYSVTVTDNKGCTMNGFANIVSPSELNLTYTIQNATCFGASNGKVIMNASGGTLPYTYNIYTNNTIIPEAMFQQMYAGLYTLRVEDANGCVRTHETQIKEPNIIDISYHITDPSCRGNSDGSILLNATGGTQPYQYSLNDYKNEDANFQNLISGKYEITIIDANGCKQIIDNIRLEESELDCIIIPNAFTPNGDGVNDTWIIENLWIFPKAQVIVFNRWGQEIYNGKYDDEPWDGKYKGKNMPIGQYVYVINLFDGYKPYVGIVSLVY